MRIPLEEKKVKDCGSPPETIEYHYIAPVLGVVQWRRVGYPTDLLTIAAYEKGIQNIFKNITAEISGSSPQERFKMTGMSK